jgi:hypothetical protein
MTALVMEEDEVHLMVDEEDSKERIFQIYLTHFLEEDFLEADKQVEGKQKDDEKIWNMTYI